MGDQSQPRRKPSSAATAEERRVGGRGRLERGATGNWSGGGVEDRRVAVVARAGASTGQHRRSGRRQRPTGAGSDGRLERRQQPVPARPLGKERAAHRAQEERAEVTQEKQDRDRGSFVRSSFL